MGKSLALWGGKDSSAGKNNDLHHQKVKISLLIVRIGVHTTTSFRSTNGSMRKWLAQELQ